MSVIGSYKQSLSELTYFYEFMIDQSSYKVAVFCEIFRNVSILEWLATTRAFWTSVEGGVKLGRRSMSMSL